MDFLFDFQRNLKKNTGGRGQTTDTIQDERLLVGLFCSSSSCCFLFVDLLRFTITSNQLPFILNYKLKPKLCVYVCKTETCVFLIFFVSSALN